MSPPVGFAYKNSLSVKKIRGVRGVCEVGRLTEADRDGREAGNGGSADGDASQGGADGANSEHGVVEGVV